jgi:pyridoxamine 5'-phosphate oxidase
MMEDSRMEMDQATDPFELFQLWFDEARISEPSDANAMALATATASGIPSVRIVLLKAIDQHGCVFYTNIESRKGNDLASNPVASLCFHWKSLRRQVRIAGTVTPVTPAEADDYFHSRPRDSRIGAWASDQSRPLDCRATLEARIAEVEARFSGDDVPRPSHWSGYRLLPGQFEFWHDRPFRLHDRIVFSAGPDGWIRSRLYP